MRAIVGLPKTVLAETDIASGSAVADLRSHGVDPLVAIGRIHWHRSNTFSSLPRRGRLLEPWGSP